MSLPASLLEELSWRGLAYQYTEGVAEWLARGPLVAYVGFDPTAPSLHVGNLVPLMALVHVQRAGHRPVALVGGGTGMIGDPSGKSAERPLQSVDAIVQHARAIGFQLQRYLDFDGPNAARLVDNSEWLRPLGTIEFLRDVGKHFTINYMLAKESVKARLEAGISFTEFAYMLLQAYDYLELHRREGASLQLGGSDQWGNITAGVELIRRAEGHEAHAITTPLVASASGKKFGKTEAGAVWLDASRTTPYQFYQFWINTDDRDVGRFLRFFTLKSREEIEALERTTAGRPDRREAQQELALEVTARTHGDDAARVAAEMSALLFGKSDPRSLSERALDALASEIPFTEIDMPANGALDTAELFVAANLLASKGAARRMLEQGGLYVNGERLTAESRAVPSSALLPGRHLLLRKGARDYGLVRIKEG
jgi:tyrosyl-tRNA synthetase